MKKLILTTIFLLSGIRAYVQNSNNDCTSYQTVVGLFNKNFISNTGNIDIDQKSFLSGLIHNLDPYYLLFNNNDLTLLEDAGLSLRTDPEHSYCKDRDLIISTYLRSLQRALDILNEIKSSVIPFTEDSIYLGDKINRAIYGEDLKKRWQRFLKLKILQDVASSTPDPDSEEKMNALFEKNKAGLELKSVEQEIQRIQRKQTEGESEKLIYYSYINCYLSLLDPHSQYLSNELFSRFREQLSSISASFGIQFEINKDHKYLVSAIKPGSYAWRTGQINLGDELIELAADNKSRLILKNSGVEDFINFFSTLNSDKLYLTTINGNNVTRTIEVYKEKIEDEENIVQAFIINGKRKFGYILLPSFYTFWESDNSSSCAQDVGKALYLLNKEKIQSLILDLRNNGGGSIKEALELAGLFIDFGALSIEKDKSMELIPRRDINRGMMYSAPLLILTNNASASASEMLVAVLQDYNRAIIAGSKTFGKASGQSLFPVEIAGHKKASGTAEKADFLKITTAKYYRVTGKSYQRSGIVPDIIIPSPNLNLEETEDSFSGALPKDSLPKGFFIKALPPLPVNYLKDRSRERISKNPNFRELQRLDSLLIHSSWKNEYINLNPSEYFRKTIALEGLMLKLKTSCSIPSEKFTVSSIYNEKNKVNFYKHITGADEERRKQLISDPVIDEAYSILIDLNETQK